MADNSNSSPLELGAKMDYLEHERTYNGFVVLVKWAAVVLVALMAAMAIGFFVAGAGSASIVFVLICLAAWYIL